MPEPIFSEDPFESEDVKAPTLDDLLQQMPPEARQGLLAARMLQREAFQMRRNEQCPCPTCSPSEFEFDVKVISLSHPNAEAFIQAKINNGWSPDILSAHNGTILFMFSRKKACHKEEKEHV